MGVKENKLQVMSDLHLEFQADGGRALLAGQQGLDPSASAVILAGDIGVAGKLQQGLADGLAFFAGRYEQVFFVPGNHEYYGCQAPETVGGLRALAASVPRVTGAVLRSGCRRRLRRQPEGSTWRSRQSARFHLDSQHGLPKVRKRRRDSLRPLLYLRERAADHDSRRCFEA